MTYLTNKLAPGENVILITRCHWIIFLKSYFILAIGGVFVSSHETQGLGIIITILGFINCYLTFAKFKTDVYAVTSLRVIKVSGLFSRKTEELFVSKIESLKVKQGFLGRMFDFGDIVISGTGGSKETFRTVPRPQNFQTQVQKQILRVYF